MNNEGTCSFLSFFLIKFRNQGGFLRKNEEKLTHSYASALKSSIQIAPKYSETCFKYLETY